ncbi:MAG TPA: hypothetical protein PLV72_01940 [Candidatus Magasanikbacteria bacterium]|nr:hypothetical protein [Candidatus Magasanikbacteria bacterium]
MKKIILLLMMVILGTLFAGAVLAGPNIGEEWMKSSAASGGFDTANTSDTAFAAQIGGYVKIALSFVGSIFFVLTLYAGFLWMTARGEDDQIKKSKDILKAAVIGLAITLGAYSITAFVVPRVMSQSQTGTGVTVQQ